MGEVTNNSMTAVCCSLPPPTLEVVASPTLFDIKREAESKFRLRKGTLSRATRTIEYVRARKWFVDAATAFGYAHREIDRFMKWSYGMARHYKHNVNV